jgi:hypothetical protein
MQTQDLQICRFTQTKQRTLGLARGPLKSETYMYTLGYGLSARFARTRTQSGKEKVRGRRTIKRRHFATYAHHVTQ